MLVLCPQDDMPELAKDHSDSSWAADHSTENAIALTERTFHDASRILFRLAHLLFSLIFVESMMGRKKQKKDFVDTLQTKDKPAQDQKEPVPEIISS